MQTTPKYSSRLATLTASLVSLLVIAGCGVPGAVQHTKASNLDIIGADGSRIHILPMAAAQNGSAPAGAKLQYYGGHVISNVKVVQVLYGAGQYQPEIQGTQMGSFYQQATNSAYWDWLSEYNTDLTAVGGQTGTNQVIGRGSFAGQVQITPSAKNNGRTIDDSQIQAELNAQISAGTLPAPDSNTIYMIDFPHGKVISQGGQNSCVVFCAYHGTFTRNGASVYYGVLPDMEAGSGCEGGCGGDPNPFNNATSVASHELVEATTDAEVGLATTVGPPLAWYDTNNGEIGDICNANQGTFVGADGVTYTVQKEFSNKSNDCIVSNGTGPADGGMGGTDGGVVPATNAVNFEVDNATTFWGQNVYVVGNTAELGNWDTTKAILLAPTAYPNWTGTVNLQQGETIQFKFIKIDPSGHVTWESGNNRTYTVPTGNSPSGSYTETWS